MHTSGKVKNADKGRSKQPKTKNPQSRIQGRLTNKDQRSRRKPNKKLREIRISKEDQASATGQRIQKEAKISSKEGRKEKILKEGQEHIKNRKWPPKSKRKPEKIQGRQKNLEGRQKVKESRKKPK